MIEQPILRPRLTVSVPCYGRPQRTIRAVECIAKQKSYNFEALVTGDGCPVMQDFINSGEFNDMQKEIEGKNSKLILHNMDKNHGGSGYYVTNYHIKKATGTYFIFYANDDVILDNHFEHYLSEIENTDYGFVYFNSFVKPYHHIRVSSLKFGSIGHSEIIVRTDLIKAMPEHTPEYGHDWKLIDNLVQSDCKYKKANSAIPTYYVMSLPNHREKNID